MSAFWQIVLVGVGTYLIRLSGLLLLDRFGGLSPAVERRLKLVVPAVLSALIFDQLFVSDGAIAFRWQWLVGALVAGIVGWKLRRVGTTMAISLIVVWLLQAIG